MQRNNVIFQPIKKNSHEGRPQFRFSLHGWIESPCVSWNYFQPRSTSIFVAPPSNLKLPSTESQTTHGVVKHELPEIEADHHHQLKDVQRKVGVIQSQTLNINDCWKMLIPSLISLKLPIHSTSTWTAQWKKEFKYKTFLMSNLASFLPEAQAHSRIWFWKLAFYSLSLSVSLSPCMLQIWYEQRRLLSWYPAEPASTWRATLYGTVYTTTRSLLDCKPCRMLLIYLPAPFYNIEN